MNEEDENAHPWKRAAWETREKIREALIQLPDGIDKHTPLVESRPGASPNPRDLQVFLTNALVDYAGYVAPEANLVKERWTEELFTVRVIDDGEVDLRTTNAWGEVEEEAVNEKLEQREIPVTLGSLRERFQMNNVSEVRISVHGDYHDTRRYTYYLPIAGASVVFEQIDGCLNELNWLPDTPPEPDRDTVSSVPDHIRGSAPAYSTNGR